MPGRAAGIGARELVLLALFALSLLARWTWLGIERPAPEPRVERVECVSYAPFRNAGETPYDAANRVSRERIRADLRLLASITDCVRTYSIDQGLDAVPSVARELGMRVLLGVWLGRDRARNADEFERALAIVRSEPDAVRALVVGNEVLLRGELSEEELRALAARARRELDVPVTYADVWEFWLRHPRLAGSVDFVTVHVLPYWEDEPVAADAAVRHVVSVLRQVQDAFPGREILLGETGWPRAGRQRDAAVPGRVEQARFVRGFVDAAAEASLRYNLIEAFDQPWKRRLEGAMGGYWGLFDGDGKRAFPWHGPVRADPRWLDGWAGTGLGLLAFATAALVAAGRPDRRPAQRPRRFADRRQALRFVFAQALAGAAAGALLVAQWRHAVQWNQHGSHELLALLGAVGTVAYAWAAIAHAARSDGPTRAPVLGALRFGYLFAAAMTIVLLVFDARYRGFPWAVFAMPVAMQALLALRGERLPRAAREERALCIVIVAGGAIVLLQETLRNAQAWMFVGALVLFASACAGVPAWRTSTSIPSNAPKAEGAKE